MHTKGPWETPGTDGDARVISYHNAGRRRTLAHVYQTETGDMDATARLIAAAPELLEACKQALPWIRRWTAANDEEGQAVILALETALAKAEGGTP